MKKQVDIGRVKEAARRYYEEGYMCSESVLRALYEQFEFDLPVEVLGAASAFGGGIGGTGCACGTVTGGAIALGLSLGRCDKSGSPLVSKQAAAELHRCFKEKHGSTCCRVLTRPFDKSKGENRAQCAGFAADTAAEAARILMERLG